MNNIIATLSLFIVGMAAKAQNNATVFTKIEISGNIELVYTETSAPSVKTDSQNLVTQIENGTLKIYRTDADPQTAKIYVTGSELESIEAKSDAKVVVKNQLSAREVLLTLDSGATFTGNIKSSKKVTLRTDDDTVFNGRIETGTLYGKFDSNAKVNLSGTATTAKLDANARALCLAGNLDASKLSVNASSYSTVKVYGRQNLDIDVSGMAKVTYIGKPSSVNMNENAVALGGKSFETIAAK